MNDADLLYGWISGSRRLTTTEQIYLCGKGFCRFRTEARCILVSPRGQHEASKPRRRFRPMGSPATAGEIVYALQGGSISLNDELSASLGAAGMTTQKATMSTLEITDMGRSVMLEAYPVKEIRNIYGSELLR